MKTCNKCILKRVKPLYFQSCSTSLNPHTTQESIETWFSRLFFIGLSKDTIPRKLKNALNFVFFYFEKGYKCPTTI